jgi:D-glycero-D-manno-heptose 1,7-bisphosphate phosphatase
MKAIILDRDGVINKCMPPHEYITKLIEVKYLEENIEIFSKLKKNIPIFIITNQQGVGKGLMLKKELNTINQKILNHLESRNIYIKKIYSCIHLASDNCSCRKPKPEMILKIARDYLIDLKESIFIGDSETDIHCARNAKCKSIYIGKSKINILPTYHAKNSMQLLRVLKMEKFIESSHQNN